MAKSNSFGTYTILALIVAGLLGSLSFLLHAQLISITNELLVHASISEELLATITKTNFLLTITFILLLTFICLSCILGYFYVRKQYISPLLRCNEIARDFIAGNYVIRIQDTFSNPDFCVLKNTLNSLFKAAFSDKEIVPEILLQHKYRQIINYLKEKADVVSITDIRQQFKLTPTQCLAQLEYLVSKGYVSKIDLQRYAFIEKQI